MSLERRLRWFDEGAPMLRLAFSRLGLGEALPANEEYYACPCCLVGYPREAVARGILTEEHVPPLGLGGRGLLLTCATCNSNSGTNFDAHAVRRSDAEDFVRGRVDGSTFPATANTDGIPLRGTAQRTDDGIQFLGVPKWNHPEQQAAHFEALGAYVETGNPKSNHSITVHFRFREARARISWIRSAYLVTFAALGWTYSFREVMDPFRSQFKQPAARILPTYIARDPSASPTERRVLLVNEPDELRCVAVVLGEHTVFLPGLVRPMTCDELVDAFARRRGQGISSTWTSMARRCHGRGGRRTSWIGQRKHEQSQQTAHLGLRGGFPSQRGLSAIDPVMCAKTTEGT